MKQWPSNPLAMPAARNPQSRSGNWKSRSQNITYFPHNPEDQTICSKKIPTFSSHGAFHSRFSRIDYATLSRRVCNTVPARRFERQFRRNRRRKFLHATMRLVQGSQAAPRLRNRRNIEDHRFHAGGRVDQLAETAYRTSIAVRQQHE